LIKSADTVAAEDATSEVGSLHEELFGVGYPNKQAAAEMSAKAGRPTRGLVMQPAEAAARAQAAAPWVKEEAVEDGKGTRTGEKEEAEEVQVVEEEEASLWGCRHCTLRNEAWRRRCRLCMRAVKHQGERLCG